MSRRDIPEPIPNPNERTKSWSFIEVTKKNGKWCYRKDNHVRNFDMILRMWVEDPSKRTTEYLSLESQGVAKKQQLKVLILRTTINSHLKQVHGYFLQTVECTVPEAPEYKDWFLKVVKGHKTRRKWCKGYFVLSDLALGTAQILFMQHRWVKKVGEEKRVLEKNVEKMIESGEVSDLLSEDPNTGKFSERTVVFNVRL